MTDKRQHPSGRPVRNERVIGRPVWRVPESGYVTPRLREPDRLTHAVGFTARLTAEDEADE